MVIWVVIQGHDIRTAPDTSTPSSTPCDTEEHGHTGRRLTPNEVISGKYKNQWNVRFQGDDKIWSTDIDVHNTALCTQHCTVVHNRDTGLHTPTLRQLCPDPGEGMRAVLNSDT